MVAASLMVGLTTQTASSSAVSATSVAGSEGSLGGWKLYRAGGAVIGRGAAKPTATRATFQGRSGNFSLFRQLTRTSRPGERLVVSLAVRGSSERSVCVLVREFERDTRVGFARRCAALRSSWQQLRVGYRQRGNGNRLRVTVYQRHAAAGASFEVTAVSFTRPSLRVTSTRSLVSSEPPDTQATKPIPPGQIPKQDPARAPSSPAPAADAPTGKLPWAPPALTDPTTILVSNSSSTVHLDSSRDYVILMPSTPLTAEGGLSLVGGRNLIIRGGEIHNDSPIASGESVDKAYGLYLKSQTGTVHLEGLWIHGRGIGQALILDQGNGATIQMQQTRLETLHPVGNVHTDGIQTWRGPHRLKLSNVTIKTAGVALQTMPHQYEPVAIDSWEYRNTNVEQLTGDAYALWKGDHAGGWWRETHTNFWVKNLGHLAWPDASYWN
ncbi:MAG: hypothetical protein ABIR67_11945, partial [Gaiellaceae bacterium]